MLHNDYIRRFVLLLLLLTMSVASYAFFQYLQSRKTDTLLTTLDTVWAERNIQKCGDIVAEEGEAACFTRAWAAFADANVCQYVGAREADCTAWYAKITEAMQTAEEQRQAFTYEIRPVTVTYDDGSTQVFTTEIAKTPEQRVQGLSYRAPLAQDQAMLFLFEAPGSHTFHMHAMLQSLDLYFLDRDQKILGAERYVPSCVPMDTCPLFGAQYTNTAYVLEVPVQGKVIRSVQF